MPLGLLRAVSGGWLDGLIMRVTDAMLAIPFLIVAIALAAFLGPSLANAMIAIGIAALPTFLRLARGTALAITTEEYIESARALGCSRRCGSPCGTSCPTSLPPLLIQSSLTVAAAIIAEASLSFLGLGQQPPAPSWGSMLNAAQRYLSQAPWMALYPGLMIFGIVMALNVAGRRPARRPRPAAPVSDIGKEEDPVSHLHDPDHQPEGLARRDPRRARPPGSSRCTDAEIADVDRALAAAKATGLPLEIDPARALPAHRACAPRLEQAVAEMYDGRGFVVLRGLPVRRYSDDDVGLIFWGFGRYIGAPLYQNPQGELLGHVYDHGRTYGNIDVRGYETNAYLPYHTDAGDMVGLLCLRRSLEGGLSSIVSSVTVHNEILAQHPEYLGLLYNGFYYIRREAALTERGVSERPIPVFGYRDGVVSCRYIRNQINAGAVKRGVPLTTFERAALDFLDEQTRRADLRLDMDLRAGRHPVHQQLHDPALAHRVRRRPRAHQKRHMLRLWLKFPKAWPLSAEFPTHMGYKPSKDTPELIEAER